MDFWFSDFVFEGVGATDSITSAAGAMRCDVKLEILVSGGDESIKSCKCDRKLKTA